MTRWYRVFYTCPQCGRVHTVTNQRRIDGGPTEAGTVAELYPAGELPADLAELMRDWLICDGGGEAYRIDDPARMRLEPWPFV